MTQFDLFESSQNDILSADTYSEFKKRFLRNGCTQCSLSENIRNLVIDRGNHESKLLLIGEGPGEQEDLQGAAFVGKAGKMLDKIMTSIGLDTNKDMLIINVVKCRPPQNRAPSQAEVKVCRVYLEKQISLINPSTIILLGATALKHLIPEKKNFSMEDEVGKFFTHPHYPNIQFMVLYHPAYLLYDPRKKKNMWEHVKKLAEYLGLKIEKGRI